MLSEWALASCRPMFWLLVPLDTSPWVHLYLGHFTLSLPFLRLNSLLCYMEMLPGPSQKRHNTGEGRGWYEGPSVVQGGESDPSSVIHCGHCYSSAGQQMMKLSKGLGLLGTMGECYPLPREMCLCTAKSLPPLPYLYFSIYFINHK